MMTLAVRRRESNPANRTGCSNQRPKLRFTPYAWAKLLYLRDAGDTEIGAFGISSADDLKLIEDLQLVRQECSATNVRLDDEAVANFFDEQIDAGRKPEQFARIWLHTHPSDSAEPSGVDEETFQRYFGGIGWAVMFILARGGQTYSKLRYGVGAGMATRLRTKVDFTLAFKGSDVEAWKDEYERNVSSENLRLGDRLGDNRCVATVNRPMSSNDEQISKEWLRRFDDSLFMECNGFGRCLTKSLA